LASKFGVHILPTLFLESARLYRLYDFGLATFGFKTAFKNTVIKTTTLQK
jgi:hypothetical protein